MESKNRETYGAPTMLVMEVKTEGIICTSGDRDDYGNVFELD